MPSTARPVGRPAPRRAVLPPRRATAGQRDPGDFGLSEGLRLLRAGRYAEAADQLGAAAGHDGGAPLPGVDDGAAWAWTGHARLLAGEPQAAVHALRKAVYLDPTLAAARFLLAQALLGVGAPREAVRALRAAATALLAVPTDAPPTSVVGRRGSAAMEPLLTALLDGRPPAELAAVCLAQADELEPLAVTAGLSREAS